MAVFSFGCIRRSVSLLASVILILVAPIHLQSQQAQPPPSRDTDESAQPTPSLRRETSRVLVDVVVLSQGRSVHGIPKEQFHVYDDNQERPILSLEEQQADAQRSIVAPLALPAGTFSNQPEYPAGMPVNVLFFDGLNTPVKDQAEVRAQMIGYLAKIPPGTPFALYALSTHLQILEGYIRSGRKGNEGMPVGGWPDRVRFERKAIELCRSRDENPVAARFLPEASGDRDPRTDVDRPALRPGVPSGCRPRRYCRCSGFNPDSAPAAHP